LRLSVTETFLIFVAIPAAGVVLIAALALAAGGARRAPRYRPGRPFAFAPVWFLSSPEQLTGPARAGHADETTGTRARTGETGGASDRW
jgi:hypothetical protein